MKAVVFHEYGGLDKLRYEDAPEPRIGHGEILVRVKACALNHLDIWERQGGVPLPHISGSDIAGELVDLASDVSNIKKGDRVIVFPAVNCGRCEACMSDRPTQCEKIQLIGYQLDGGYAEYVKAPASNIFQTPASLTDEQAAALPLAGSTAWHMLVAKGHVAPTDWVLILGAGSGVSVYAIQLAKIFGAKIIVTTGSNEKIQKALDLGANHVINHKQSDITEEVRKITDGRGVDIVIEHVGAATFNKSLMSLRKGGRLITAGVTTGKEVKVDIQYLYRNELVLEGSYVYTKAEFSKILRLATDGRLRPIISNVFPLEEAAEAQRTMEEAKQFGKIVLRI